jgi:hypothetical protein
MNWLRTGPNFHLSANLHGTTLSSASMSAVPCLITFLFLILFRQTIGGDVVANYPFDGTKNHATAYSACDDDDVFRRISYSYAKHNPEFLNNPEFTDGITNGARWYPLYGGMQDVRLSTHTHTHTLTHSLTHSHSILIIT